MGVGEGARVRGPLSLLDAARRLEAADGVPLLSPYEPVEGWHRSAVVEVRSVLDHDRLTRGAAHDNLALASRRATEQFCDEGQILRRHARLLDKGPRPWPGTGVTSSGDEARR